MILTIEKLRNFLSHIIPAWISTWVLCRMLALLVYRSIGTEWYNDTKMMEIGKNSRSRRLRPFPSERLNIASVFVCSSKKLDYHFLDQYPQANRCIYCRLTNRFHEYVALVLRHYQNLLTNQKVDILMAI